MSETYKTLENNCTGEFKDKGSKFIAYCFPLKDAEDVANKISQIRKEHPKARHFCYAYRLGISKNIFRTNDDGEPSGTAGKPILGQIDSFELTNIIVIVVRYFGGILLGTGGLINAYREAAKNSLSNAIIKEIVILYQVTVSCEYSFLPDLINFIKRNKIKLVESDFTEGCILKLSVNKDQLEKLTNLYGISIAQEN